MLTSQMYEAPPKKGHRLRNWLIGIGLAVAVLIGGAVGCAAIVGSTLNTAANPDSISSHGAAHTGSRSSAAGSAAPSRPAELRLGDSALINQDGTDGATVMLTTRSVSSQPADQFSDGPQNGYFVAVRIKVNAVDGLTSGFNINPLDFYALAGRAHYDEGDGNAYEGPYSEAELNATTLNAGETATGWLLFDLPARHGKVVYAPNLAGQPLASWAF
jgi:hypothetical protein